MEDQSRAVDVDGQAPNWGEIQTTRTGQARALTAARLAAGLALSHTIAHPNPQSDPRAPFSAAAHSDFPSQATRVASRES